MPESTPPPLEKPKSLRRSPLVWIGSVVWIALVAGLVWFAVTRIAARSRGTDAVEKLEAVTRENEADMRASLAKEGMITPENQTRVVDKALTAFSDAAANTRGEEREIALGMEAFMQWAKSCQQQQVAVMEDLQMETFFDLAQHATPEQRARKRMAIADFKAANVQLREFVNGGAAWIERELQRRQVRPVQIKAVLAGYAETADRQLPILLSIRKLDEDFAELLAGFVTFAESIEGQWSIEDGTGNVLLPNDEAVAQYNGFLTRVQEIGQEQAALQRQLF